MMKIFRNYDPETAGICDKCALEVYDSDIIYIIDGFIICNECFGDYARDYFYHCRTYGETLRRIK